MNDFRSIRLDNFSASIAACEEGSNLTPTSEEETFESFARERLRSIYRHLNTPDGSPHFNAILEQMLGAFPSVIDDLLRSEGLEVVRTKVSEKISRDGWLAIADEIGLPPEHPANYDWRFTPETTRNIADYVSKHLENSPDKTICCLGSPTIAIELVQRGWQGKIVLLDINTPLVEMIDSYARNQKADFSSQTYDVQDILPDHLENIADVVIMDPPWYLDYYRAFLARATTILSKKGGQILCPIFPELSRHGARKDILALQKELVVMGCQENELAMIARFLMPGFEEKILQRQGIATPPVDWRMAEMRALKFDAHRAKNQATKFNLEPQCWARYGDRNTAVVFRGNLGEFIGHQPSRLESFLSISRHDRRDRDILWWDSNHQCLVVTNKT
ncbi:MAG: bis-aminopropyl spermidine synthase family protein [bacterium]|nr:bis-aminopropyl spermidine synthase family protein [bacterium]